MKCKSTQGICYRVSGCFSVRLTYVIFRFRLISVWDVMVLRQANTLVERLKVKSEVVHE